MTERGSTPTEDERNVGVEVAASTWRSRNEKTQYNRNYLETVMWMAVKKKQDDEFL